MRKVYIIFIIIFFISVYYSCMQNDQALIESFDQKAAKIQEKFAPDLSINVFTVCLVKEKKNWLLEGEISVTDARDAVLSLADSLLGKDNYIDALIFLPHPSLGDSTFALVKVSTAHLRRRPGHAAELVDQSIMGNTIRLLKKQNGWYLAQTEYGYIGWVSGYSLVRCDEQGISDWKGSERVRVNVLVSFIYSQPDSKSIPVSDVVLNVTLNSIKKGKDWTIVQTPDGREGFIASKHVEPLNNKIKPAEISPEVIIQTAKSMMGIPYLWGGNTSKGNDCSGFTQSVFKANGIHLPRDARQQVLIGKEVIPTKDFSNVLSGDLLFFGLKDRITHVGISLGGYDFIHQDRYIRINSFDERAENFNAFRKKTLKAIRRIL